MKCVLLVRVSTLDQDYQAQKEDLIKYSKSLGYSDYHIIEDKESAIKLSEEERNGLNSMKEWITRNPDYRTVIVWEISRLARSEKVLHSIKEYFLDNRIQLFIYDKKYKLLNEDGTENQETSLLFSLYAYFAESEMKIKKERFRRSKRLNAETGKYNGSKIKFGYRLDENKYIVPDEHDAKIVKEIFQMYATGNYSVPMVTHEFNIRGVNLSKPYITEMLSFTGYIGYTNYDNSKRSHRKYIPIIDEALFNRVQEIKKKNNTCISKSKRYFFGNKIIKCPICGGSYIYKSDVYTCINHALYKTCDHNASVNTKLIDKLFWYIALREHKVFLGSDIDAQINNTFKEIMTLHKKTIFIQNNINKIKKKYERVNMLFINMKINERQYNELEKKINDEIKEKEKEISECDTLINNKEIAMNSLSNKNINDIVNGNITLQEMRDIVRQYITLTHIYKETRGKRKIYRFEITYKKMKSIGGYDLCTENYYYFPRGRKRLIEYNNEFIDEKIKEECGDTLNVIENTKQFREVYYEKHGRH